MWTMTPHGFFSAVQHRDDPRLLVVRTRDKADAQHLRDWYAQFLKGDWKAPWAPPAKITAYQTSDYPWRVILPNVAYAQFIGEEVAGIDYGNFKDRVKEAQGATRAAVYSEVWSVLLELEDHDPHSTRPRDRAWPAIETEPDWGTE